MARLFVEHPWIPAGGKKIDFGSFGRQRASNITTLASLGIQLAVFGIGALALLGARAWGHIWAASV